MKVPDVSVVVAVYNEEQFIEAALASILSQEGVDVEVVVVDDQSTDGTAKLIERLQRQWGNLQFIRNEKKGKVSAFNLGVARAGGRLVALFAGDDIMPAGSLRARVASVNAVKGDGPVVGLCRLRIMSENPKIDGQEIPKRADRGCFSGVSYLWNRAALEKFWPIPETLPNEDTWLEVVAQHADIDIIHSGVIGCSWRMYEGNSINVLLPWQEFNKRYTPRMAAAWHFLNARGDTLTEEARRRLRARVECEDARIRGDLAGILLTNADWVTKLRAAAFSGRRMYALRQLGLKLLSGF